MNTAAPTQQNLVVRRVVLALVCASFALAMVAALLRINAMRTFVTTMPEEMQSAATFIVAGTVVNFALSGTIIYWLLTGKSKARFYFAILVLALVNGGTIFLANCLISAFYSVPVGAPHIGLPDAILVALVTIGLLWLVEAYRLIPAQKIRASLADSIGHRSYDEHARLEDTFE